MLVVDCNDEVIRYIGEKIENTFGAKTKGILIQEIEDDPEAALAMVEDQDLLVCGFNYLEELDRALPGIAAQVEVGGGSSAGGCRCDQCPGQAT